MYMYTVILNTEVDRIWGKEGISRGSLKGHPLSTPGWLCTSIYIYTYRHRYRILI